MKKFYILTLIILSNLLMLKKYNFAFEENYKFFLLNDINKSFLIGYAIKPFDTQVLTVEGDVNNFLLLLNHRNFDNIELIDENKNLISTISLYDLYLGLGYNIFINESYLLPVLIDLKYDYYYFNYKITLGGMVGIGIKANSINYFILFGNIEEALNFCFEFNWEIYKNTFLLEGGTILGLDTQTIFAFIDSTIFNYNSFQIGIKSGGIYSTSKGFIPSFSVKLKYINIGINYGIVFEDIIGISQFIFVEFR
ncbi:MAG: hypothetical protein ACP5PT_03105 [Brevinematia bacterium]